jgi:hypothetical protein
MSTIMVATDNGRVVSAVVIRYTGFSESHGD